MSKFEYAKDIPAEITPVLSAYLEPLSWLVPAWCDRVIVYWRDATGDDDKDTEACTWCQYEYRNASIQFYAKFLSIESEGERQKTMIHELLHSFSSPLADYARSTIEMTLEGEANEMARKLALNELTQRNESWVQDMAICIQNHLLTNG